jgi:hypothetical protein
MSSIDAVAAAANDLSRVVVAPPLRVQLDAADAAVAAAESALDDALREARRLLVSFV